MSRFTNLRAGINDIFNSLSAMVRYLEGMSNQIITATDDRFTDRPSHINAMKLTRANEVCVDSNLDNKFQAFRLRSEDGASGHAWDKA